MPLQRLACSVVRLDFPMFVFHRPPHNFAPVPDVSKLTGNDTSRHRSFDPGNDDSPDLTPRLEMEPFECASSKHTLNACHREPDNTHIPYVHIFQFLRDFHWA
jgi:hypothetical protein